MNSVQIINSTLQNSLSSPITTASDDNIHLDSTSSMLVLVHPFDLPTVSSPHKTQAATIRGANGLTENEMALLNQDNLTRLKDLVAACCANPNILYVPGLYFFKEYLESLKANIPNRIDKQKTIHLTHTLGRATAAPVNPMVEEDDQSFSDLGDSAAIDIEVMDDVDNPDRPHQCKQCKRRYKCIRTLRKHIKLHTGDTPYKCNQCGQIFVCNNHLKHHMTRHSGEKPYKCNQCDKTFRYSTVLKTHMKVHSNEKPYTCHICEKSYKHNQHLSAHMCVHKGMRPYKCLQCDKTYIHKADLKKHMITHSNGDGSYKCNQCDAIYAYSSKFYQHLRTHREKPLSCGECGKKFLTNSALKVHLKIHMGERPFKCNQCVKTFKHSRGLRIHMFTHTGGNPYQCSQCDKSYPVISDLKRHIFSKHSTEDKKYECTECGKAFLYESYYTKHMTIHSSLDGNILDKQKLGKDMNILHILNEKDMYKCILCDTNFPDKFTFEIHMGKHTENETYKCSKCDNAFKLESSLKIHLKKHTEQ